MAKKQQINVVWIKRDIRTQDHLPLFYAEQEPLPYLIIFIFEPSIYLYSDTSIRHLQFQYHSILQVNKTLNKFNKEIHIFNAEAIEVFQSILKQFSINKVFSYQESGIDLTYQRDKRISNFLKENEIIWQQYQRDGIIRGIKNRTDWDKNWYSTMHSSITSNIYKKTLPLNFVNNYNLPNTFLNKLKDYPISFQPAGEIYAFKYLQSFINERGFNYNKHISKPLNSRLSCGRVSPYISWGNVSIKQVYQFIYNNKKNITQKAPFNNFLTRLRWHCHFIQKFEMECSYETKCVNAGYELLQHTKNEEYITAWKNGNTGFPLVDACMKCLIETGWINFRMRAMLVSFFCHHLYQDWRDGAYYLAQLFLDYEPGIHFPQFQMQAGTTGINTIRMYNPIKQSIDHDSKGEFIKKWLPVLQNIPEQFIHEPHKMTLIEQKLYNVIIGIDYPKPIVDIETAGKLAKEKIWNHRKNELVKKENIRILYKHTKRKENDIK